MSNDTAIASLQDKIDDLNQQAWEARVNDSSKAFELSQESVKMARSIDYPKGLADGLRSLGFAYIRLFKNDEAAPLLRESLSLFQSLNDLKGQAIVYEYLGILERNWGNLGASLEFLLKGNDLVRQTGPLEIEITSCYQVGVTYKHLGNHENALDYLFKALALSKKINLTLMESYATNIIGSIYFDNGDYKHALDCYQQGLIIRQQSHDKWGEAGSLDNIGFTYLKLNDLDKAVDYCKQSLQITQATGDKKGEANTLLHLAEIYQQAGEVGQASKFSNESLEIRKARGDKRGEAEVLLFLADLHKYQSDLETHQIFEWLSGALKIAEQIKAQDLLSKSRYKLHEYHTQKGNYKESLVQLEAHLQIEKELHKNTINQKISNLEISHKAETISQRNKELTELNARIEKANAELKVEASLERVRAVAMGMKEPADMINVCRMISDQLEQLGFEEIRNVQTAIIYPQKHEYLNYQYFTPYDKVSVETIDYRLHPDVLEFTNQMLASADAYYTKTFEGEELKAWREYRKRTNQLPDPKLDATSSSHYYFYSIGSGALGVTAYAPLSEEQIVLFKRFRNVFELAYRRFIDIEKALAQAREAQIEAALERVRAKSMAMHHSDDLITVINVVQEQLLGLGFHFHGANFVTDYNEKGYTMWLASPGESFPYKIYVPQIGQKYFEAVKEAIEKGADFATYTLNFEEKNIYFKNLFENSLAKNTSNDGKRMVYEAKGMAASVVLLEKVRLNLMNLDLIPFTDEENNVLRRFGYVFEQSYTRFLDLQKAEAQAKEAQTEVALERIRARAMAMHSSNELMDVAHILREQMGLLDQPDLETSVVNLFDEDSDYIHSWHAFREPGSSSGRIINGTVTFRKDSSELTREMIGHYQSGEKEYTLEATGEKLNEFIQVLINSEPQISNYIGKHPPEKVYYHFATFKGGALLTVSYQPTTEGIKSLQRRAAAVFDMAYRRYLDLKKAEAQTREAQIEIAVERVRAKALAMHKSEEILAVVATLRNELLSLNIPGVSGTTIYLKQDDGRLRMWDLTSVIELEEGFHLTLDIVFQLEETHPKLYIRELWNATEKYSIQKQDRNDLMRTVEWLAAYKKDEAENVKRFIETSDLRNLFHSTVPLANGKLSVDLMEPPPAEMESILQKMATAFDLAYKRFLDLQKAEAQAREAQIEAAVEKVRSRSLAMHKSDELQEVVHTVFERLKELNVDFYTAIIILFTKDSKDIIWWLESKADQQYSRMLVPYAPISYFKDLFEIRETGGDLLSTCYSFDEKNELFHHLFENTNFKYVPEKQKQFLLGAEFATMSVALAKNTGIHITSYSKKSFSDQDNQIVKRFANVFDQAYTRFLDLQKAEAQAREAQIEAALERVRSRTMGMHKSDELAEVATVLFEQMSLLDNTPDRFNIRIANEADGVFEFWATDQEGHLVNKFFRAAFDRSPVVLQMYTSWKAKENILIQDLHGDQLSEWVHYIKDVLGVPFNTKLLKEHRFLSSVFFSHGMIGITTNDAPNPVTLQLIERFAKVFEQTYTRFLDLQKAEAQARDAQIEMALERVRAKVMAMTNSTDLNETSLVFGEQLRKLGIHWQFSYFWLVEEPKNENTFWITWPDNKTSFTSYTLAEAEEYFNDCLISWRAGVKIHDNYVPPEGVKEWLDTFQRIADDAGGEAKKIMVPQTFANGVYYYDAMMKYGSFGICLSKPASDEEKKIQCRFAIEFERAYTRFLDLKQAEAQTREAKIEAALERVRAKAMAMHKSNDFNDAVAIVFEELDKLNLGMLRCGIGIFNKEKRSAEVWTTTIAEHGRTVQVCGDESMDIHPLLKGDFAAWLRQEDFFYVLEGEDMSEYYRAVMETNFKLPESQIMVEHPEQLKQLYYAAMFESGSMFAFRETDFPEEAKVVMKRFAGVFNLTYKRFLDLQKAEAQTRESQIELGLERVRARAMAMQNSDELKELIGTVYTELTKLDLILDRCFIMIFDNKSMGVTWWMSNPEAPSQPIGLFVKYHEQPPYQAFIKGWKERNLKWQYVLEGEIKKTWDRFLFVETELSQLPDFVIANMKANEKVYLSASFNNFGSLTLATLESLSDEHFDILLRFAKVFDLTYTRFNDLKQAEAQAREAQIELGLERVRARAMAMQNSDELNDLVAILFEELTKLDLILARCIIWILDNDELSARLWMANSEDKKAAESYYIKRLQHSYYEAIINGWKERSIKWVYDLKGDEKKTIDKLLLNETELSRLPEAVKDGILSSEHTIVSGSFNNFGLLEASGPVELSAEQMDIVSRFAKVFDLTYTRFNDLKQAEAQAREANIEAALERVRSKAMAMHKSDDLTPAVATVFEELDKLNIGILRCGIAIMDKEKPRGDIWVTVKSEEKSTIQLSGDEPLDYHPLLQGAYAAWLKQEDFSYVLEGEELADYYRAVTKVNFQLPISATFDAEVKDQRQFYYNAVFQDGSLFAFMETGIIDEAKMVIKRFANVFNLTYKRFLDLQKAEAQTREAKIEAALERVRARALAMQEPEELKDVAQVLRSEMGELGVEELETSSIYINDEATNKTECWYALKAVREEGKKLVSDHFPLNLDDTWVGREMKNFYRSDAKQVSIVMQGVNRKEWINYCEEKSVPFRGYYGEVIPDRTYHLYKFSHGAIGAAAAGDISAESWKLLSRAASVFSLAYSRFKDLTQARTDLIKLKEEKKRAEEALTELQTTQKQLVQSEKMASLGELTAGIAHEIQNPLNFVNNFSDVSNELLEEMKQELATGNTQQAIEIVNNVKENLEKILHHGKRADAIVKGMLQHSRSSGGQKELTDINTLAEEYLRLAYHGLRAKDKFFNAKFETDLDPSINKINIVPQEIGRVILNLINNSFYAVSEKKKLLKDGYEPIVTVSTKYVKPPLGGLGVVEIKVKDNGDGIPQKVLDKIFQPFFTTKPTGQGTGLGLSLSYDIITKGHGGEIKVKTREGQGSEFIISLPVN